jgi:hypothetical protein
MTCDESQGVSGLNKWNIIRTTQGQETETMTPGEGTKGSDIYSAGNQGSDGVQVSVIMLKCA